MKRQLSRAASRGVVSSSFECAQQCYFYSTKTKQVGKWRAYQGYWEDPGNQREWLDKLAPELGLQQMSDWYAVSRKEVERRGGRGLFKNGRSMASLVSSAYPDFPWQPERFIGSRRKKQELDQLLEALEKAATAFGIQEPEDWYHMKLTDLIEVGFPKVSRMQLVELLEKKYPQHSWDKVHILRGRMAEQKRLERSVQELFPGVEVISNARKEAGIVNPDTGHYLELDMYLPSLHLALEYQERQHYTNSQDIYAPLEEYKKRDQLKLALAAGKGITLVIIPCWWDRQLESLAATIKDKRPDLLPEHLFNTGKIIPNMPQGFMDAHSTSIEDIGEPSSACFFTSTKTNPANWWMFEKYDGVRGFWNPVKKSFYSRKGKRFNIPQGILDSMPNDIFLDGELWFGRDSFQEALKLAHRTEDIDWTRFQYMVYDIPNHKGTYKDRHSALVSYFTDKPNHYIHVAEKETCKDIQHLEQFFQTILDGGGEGIILRDPEAPLQPGRSPGYLKHKKFRDAEARIVTAIGHHQWECELPNGIRFTATAGTTEFANRWRPQPGDIVSFKHHGYLLSSGKPKLASLYRIRSDLAWEHVVMNWKEKKSIPSVLPLRRKKSLPKGFWEDLNNRQQFFTSVARQLGFDPLDASSWNNVTTTQIAEKKGAALVAKYGSLKEALSNTFPSLTEKLQASQKKGPGYWLAVPPLTPPSFLQDNAYC